MNHLAIICTPIIIHCYDVLKSLYIVIMYCNLYTLSWCTAITIHHDVLEYLYTLMMYSNHYTLSSIYIVMMYFNLYTLSWCTSMAKHHDVQQSLYTLMMYSNHYTLWCTSINIHRHDVLQSLYIVLMMYCSRLFMSRFWRYDNAENKMWSVLHVNALWAKFWLNSVIEIEANTHRDHVQWSQ